MPYFNAPVTFETAVGLMSNGVPIEDISATTDTSGTPGPATVSTSRGRAAFAAASASVVITNSLVVSTSTVMVALGGADATLLSVRVTPGAGSFTVTGNAAATGITPFDFRIVN